MQKRSLVRSIPGEVGGGFGVAMSPDGTQLATTISPAGVQLWDLAADRLLRLLETHSQSVLRLAVDAEGELLASGALDGTIGLWNLDARKLELRGTLATHLEGMSALGLSADRMRTSYCEASIPVRRPSSPPGARRAAPSSASRDATS